MKKIYFYSFLIMTGVWLSSCDADEVDCVDFGVTLSMIYRKYLQVSLLPLILVEIRIILFFIPVRMGVNMQIKTVCGWR